MTFSGYDFIKQFLYWLQLFNYFSCSQRTLASTANEASLFGTCKLIRDNQTPAWKSSYNATAPRCQAFVDSFSNLE